MRKIFFLSLFLFIGCAHVPKSEFVHNDSRMSRGSYLEKVFISPDFKPSEMILQIKEPAIETLQANDALPPETARTVLSRLLEHKLGSLRGVKIAGSSDSPTHVLETAITDLEPGSRALRWIIGWGMAGSSKVQVEGKLLNASGKELVLFADRRAGSAMGGYDLSGGNPRALLETDMEGIVQALADTLRDHVAV